MKIERRGFWKLNVNCLKNGDVVKDLKEETDIIKRLMGSDICLWDYEKKNKEILQIQTQTVKSRTKLEIQTANDEICRSPNRKAEKTDEDINNLHDIKSELNNMNGAACNL